MLPPCEGRVARCVAATDARPYQRSRRRNSRLMRLLRPRASRHTALTACTSSHQSALARPPARVRLPPGRARCGALPDARPARARVHRHHRRDTTISSWSGCRLQQASWNRASSSRHRRSDQGRSFTFLSQTVRRARPRNPSSQSTTAVSCCQRKQLRIGWEAGIRTPITWSRATCPTVERPPSEGRGGIGERSV